MANLEHERQRLYSLVDKFIAQSEVEKFTDLRIDEAVLCCAITGTNADELHFESTQAVGESNSAYKRIGVLNTALVTEAAQL